MEQRRERLALGGAGDSHCSESSSRGGDGGGVSKAGVKGASGGAAELP